ncbi:MAG: hypothetical protein J6Q54_08930 [Oscillospiraceae bacterium]|nr:hypothetical protein [Oscillospiraceae bacterium]
MYFQEFYYWCRDAVRKIKYIPDRNKVYLELRSHMQDRYDSLIEKGIDPKEAQRQTIEAMGDANEVADLLAAIHKPFWGYALAITRFIATVLFCLAVGNGIYYLHEEYYLRSKELTTFNYAYGEYYYAADPSAKDSSDGYTFRVTEAAIWRYPLEEAENGKDYFDRVLLRVEVYNPLPWAPEQNILEQMWAVDSSGKYYDLVLYESQGNDWGYYNIGKQQLNSTTYRYDLCINNPPEDIQWIELHYDREGRNLFLHVDLSREG